MTIQHQIGLLEEVADIRTRVMAGHGMIGVPSQGFPIFACYPGGAQSACERVAWVVNPDRSMANFFSSSLPGGVVHRTHALTAAWKHPDRIQATLRLHD